MASEAQSRMQNAVDNMLKNLQKEKIRPILREAHLNAAKCCENNALSQEQLEQCMQQSFLPAQRVQEIVSQELSQLQDRLGRCIKQCQDKAEDKLSENNTPANRTAAETEMESCAVKCVDVHIELIPKMMKRIQQAIQ